LQKASFKIIKSICNYNQKNIASELIIQIIKNRRIGIKIDHNKILIPNFLFSLSFHPTIIIIKPIRRPKGITNVETTVTIIVAYKETCCDADTSFIHIQDICFETSFQNPIAA